MEPGNSDTYMTSMSGCILRNAFFHYWPWLRAELYWWPSTDPGGVLQVWTPTLGSGQWFLPWYYTLGPGSLGIFHHVICWYRCTYNLPLESPPYIFLRFLICQEDKGRWGVNRMHHWPLSARFTCPLHSEHRLFAFLPGVTPVLTGRQESLCTPGQLGSWISLSAVGNIQGDSSSWWILSAKPSAQQQDVIT